MTDPKSQIDNCKSRPRHIVVPASANYADGLQAFLRSFARWHPDSRIHVHALTYGIDHEDVYKWSAGIPALTVMKIPEDNGQIWDCQRYRYGYAADLDGVVLLADADMFFCSNVDLYFEIAETGIIIGGCNGMHIRFTEDHCREFGLDIPTHFEPATITSVPTWLDTTLHGEVWRQVYEINCRKSICDFTLQNAVLRMLGKSDRILMLSAQQVTGIHHFQVKPNTRAIAKEGRLCAEDHMPILMVHGKWWEDGWRTGLMEPMERYARDEFNGSERVLEQARNSSDLLYAEFLKYVD